MTSHHERASDSHAPADAVCYHAAWVVPVDRPPVRDGWVLVSEGRVLECGSPHTPPPDIPAAVVRLANRILLPGLVNAHTHLELSALRGQIPHAMNMPAWAERVMARTGRAQPERVAMAAALREAHDAGTALLGDISNTMAPLEVLRSGPVAAVLFHELLGFDVADAEPLVAETVAQLDHIGGPDLRPGIAAHAPYSVSQALFSAVRRAVDRRPGFRLSVHVAESAEELEFLKNGTGSWRRILEHRGRWDGRWQPTGLGPVAYLDQLGWLRADTLLVHGVHLTDDELAHVARVGATLVTCPRSNIWTGAGIPPLSRFYESGARVAVGTDSLASVGDLNLFAEMHEIRRRAPTVPAGAIVESATRHGATALGFGDTLGMIVRGRWARLLAVACPTPLAAADVEEYLVSGVQPAQIEWVGAGNADTDR